MNAPIKTGTAQAWPLFEHRDAILKACPELETLFLSAEAALQGCGCRSCIKNVWHRRIYRALEKAAAAGQDLHSLESVVGAGFLPGKKPPKAVKTLKKGVKAPLDLDWYRGRLGEAVIQLENSCSERSPERLSALHVLRTMRKRALEEWPELAEALSTVQEQFFNWAARPPNLMDLFDLLQNHPGSRN